MSRFVCVLVFAACLLVGPAVAQAAPPPWSTPIDSSEADEVLADVAAHARLDAPARERVAAAAARGKLLVTGECVRVDPDNPEGPVEWRVKVQSLATIRVSNLSDRYVWLVDLRIAGGVEHDGLGTVRSNLPFLEPHSQAEVTMSCDGVHPFLALLDRVEVTGVAGTLSPAQARALVTTPARFDQSASFGNQVMAKAAGRSSLAALGLPRIGDRSSARVLMRAMLVEDLSAKQIGNYLGPAGAESANGIVDTLLEHPGINFAEVLETALAFGTGETLERDRALGRLLVPICAALTPEARREGSVERLFQSRSRSWQQQVIDACIIDAQDVGYLLNRLSAGQPGSDPQWSDVAGFIRLASAAHFELALPILLGGDPATGVTDGGLRPPALWYALAWLPEPSRLAVLEGLIRPGDLHVVLPLLLKSKLNEEQLALFDRVAARVVELPAAERGPALLSTMNAARQTGDVALLERMFGLAEHDPALLRPDALLMFAPRQALFRPEGVAVLTGYGLDQLTELFEGPLHECSDSLVGLRRCLDTIQANPELERAAGLGLQYDFVTAATQTLTLGDPSEEQRALLRGYLGYGVEIEPIAERVCERARERIRHDAEIDAHVDFLLEFAGEQGCTVRLLAGIRRSKRRVTTFIVVVAIGLVLVGLGFAWTRHRDPTLEQLDD